MSARSVASERRRRPDLHGSRGFRSSARRKLLHSRRMGARPHHRGLSAQDMEAILGVTSALAAPFDLMTMLAEVVNAAKQVLKADRGSVWLYDPDADELVLEVATGIRPVRVPAGAGLVGTCARQRKIINVPDCYADPRFDSAVDKASGYRTRCMLTLPLVDHKDILVGVMQVLNKSGGVFDDDDEILATALAAQCAVALQRVRMTEALIEGEKMRQELEVARVVQMSTLPGDDAFGAGLRRARHVPAGRAHRRGHLRPVRLRPGARRGAGRCDRPRDRTGAFGYPDAGDAADGVQARLRPRNRADPGQQPARRNARRRPLHHGIRRHARSVRAPDPLPQRGPGTDPPLPGGDAVPARATSRRAFRWAPCRCHRCAPR